MGSDRLDWDKLRRLKIVWERGSYPRGTDIRKGDEYIGGEKPVELAIPILRNETASDQPQEQLINELAFTLNCEGIGGLIGEIIYRFLPLSREHADVVVNFAEQMVIGNEAVLFPQFERFLAVYFAIRASRHTQSKPGALLQDGQVFCWSRTFQLRKKWVGRRIGRANG